MINKILIIKNYINNNHNDLCDLLYVPNTSINIIHSDDLNNYSLNDLEKNHDKLLILGGKDSVININKYPYMLLIIKLINLFHNNNKFILGICLGCQLITKAFGGEIKSMNVPNIGCIKGIVQHKKLDILSKKIKDQYILAVHEDYVDVSNTSLEIIASYENIPYIIKKDKTLGIQFHPDVCVDRFLLCIDKKEYNIINCTKSNRNMINNFNKDFMKKWMEKN